MSTVNSTELFRLGRLLSTPGALRAMEEAGVNPAHLLQRIEAGEMLA